MINLKKNYTISGIITAIENNELTHVEKYLRAALSFKELFRNSKTIYDFINFHNNEMDNLILSKTYMEIFKLLLDGFSTRGVESRILIENAYSMLNFVDMTKMDEGEIFLEKTKYVNRDIRDLFEVMIKVLGVEGTIILTYNLRRNL